jgi:glycerol-3-phosphate dehydrogenase
VAFLLEQAGSSLTHSIIPREIIAYRCGVRPLAVAANYHSQRYPLELSRHHRLHVARKRRWISVYGGKFTSALGMAESVSAQVTALLGKSQQPAVPPSPLQAAPHDSAFPGLTEKFPSIRHCVEHEYCLTIADYLRRRTNIAQWVARNGLGNAHEHLPFIEQLAGQLPRAAGGNPLYTLEHYVSETARVFDRLQGVGGEHKR